MSKAKEVIMRLAVMLIFLANVENTLVNSALGEITRANPDVNSSVISLVSTLPIIVMFVMSFFVAKIINHSNKKTLVLIALIIYTIGGVMGTFLAENIYMLLVARAVLGVGSGIAAPLSGTIIAQLFSGKDRTRMYGMTNAVSALVGALITMIGGFLMMIQWNYIFLAYSSMIIVIALVAVGMPSMPAEKMAEPSEKKQKIKLSGGQRGELTVLSVFMFFNTLAGWFILLKLAINITENNIGTAVLSSTAMSVFNVVVMVSSFIYIFTSY